MTKVKAFLTRDAIMPEWLRIGILIALVWGIIDKL